MNTSEKADWERDFDRLFRESGYDIVFRATGAKCNDRWFKVRDFISSLLAQVRAEERERIAKEVKRFREALIWCSGSDDFQEGGKAREGWLKIVVPFLREDPKAGQEETKA